MSIWITNVVFSFVIEISSIYGDGKSYVSLCIYKWLDANGSVGIDHGTRDYFIFETTSNFITGLETWSRDVDNRTSKHITAFGSENQGQISSSYKISKKLIRLKKYLL